MSRSLNNVQLIGNVGNDPEVRTPTKNSKVASFSLATSREWKDAQGNKQEKTEWHRLNVWGKLADVVESYVKKGDKLYIAGSLEYGQYTDKEGVTKYSTDINVRDLLMLGSKNGEAPAKGPATRKRDADEMPAALDDDDDQLPF